mmetsp:Transcript_7340/g.21689  ORF Transcript_7340/g.21689 Transcript_7340/m.21689 type:complete len:241 (-) Transcript_7340:1131-1853(-)
MLFPWPSEVPPANVTSPKGKSGGVVPGTFDHASRQVLIKFCIMQAYPVLSFTEPHATAEPGRLLSPFSASLESALWHWKTLFSPCHQKAPLIVMLTTGSTIPFHSAPLLMSQRPFCHGAYGPPDEFLQTAAFREALGCHISTIVPPHEEWIIPSGTTVSLFASMMSVRCCAACQQAAENWSTLLSHHVSSGWGYGVQPWSVWPFLQVSLAYVPTSGSIQPPTGKPPYVLYGGGGGLMYRS